MTDRIKPITFPIQTTFLDESILKQFKKNIQISRIPNKILENYLIMTYKIINNLETMILHRRPKHQLMDKEFVKTIEFVKIVSDIIADNILSAICKDENQLQVNDMTEKLLNDVFQIDGKINENPDNSKMKKVQFGVANAIANILTAAKEGILPKISNRINQTIQTNFNANRPYSARDGKYDPIKNICYSRYITDKQFNNALKDNNALSTTIKKRPIHNVHNYQQKPKIQKSVSNEKQNTILFDSTLDGVPKSKLNAIPNKIENAISIKNPRVLQDRNRNHIKDYQRKLNNQDTTTNDKKNKISSGNIDPNEVFKTTGNTNFKLNNIENKKRTMGSRSEQHINKTPVKQPFVNSSILNQKKKYVSSKAENEKSTDVQLKFANGNHKDGKEHKPQRIDKRNMDEHSRLRTNHVNKNRTDVNKLFDRTLNTNGVATIREGGTTSQSKDDHRENKFASRPVADQTKTLGNKTNNDKSNLENLTKKYLQSNRAYRTRSGSSEPSDRKRLTVGLTETINANKKPRSAAKKNITENRTNVGKSRDGQRFKSNGMTKRDNDSTTMKDGGSIKKDDGGMIKREEDGGIIMREDGGSINREDGGTLKRTDDGAMKREDGNMIKMEDGSTRTQASKSETGAIVPEQVGQKQVMSTNGQDLNAQEPLSDDKLKPTDLNNAGQITDSPGIKTVVRTSDLQITATTAMADGPGGNASIPPRVTGTIVDDCEDHGQATKSTRTIEKKIVNHESKSGGLRCDRATAPTLGDRPVENTLKTKHNVTDCSSDIDSNDDVNNYRYADSVNEVYRRATNTTDCGRVETQGSECKNRLYEVKRKCSRYEVTPITNAKYCGK